jgi:hypothetical protein
LQKVQWIFNISNLKWSLICCTACREEGLGPIQDAEADSAIISALTSAKDAQVKEEVVDALCALSSHENMRSRIVQKGAVSQLACVIQDASPEVCVRTLLALGMLCGSRYSCLPMNYDEFLEKRCTSLC